MYTIYKTGDDGNPGRIWKKAKMACEEKDAKLASMETELEWDYVLKKLKSKDKRNSHWLGGIKHGPVQPGLKNHEGFQWLSGGIISKDNPGWYDRSTHGKCILSNVADNPSGGGLWNDVPCDFSYFPYLCEMKI
jgi:hypothetical protein